MSSDINVTVELSLDGDGEEFTDRPDSVKVTFDDELISRIATARTALSLGVFSHGAHVTLALADDSRFLVEGAGEDDGVEYQEDDGSFRVSSGWLDVQDDVIGLRFWEDNSGAELVGTIYLNQGEDELRSAIEQAMPAALADLRERLNRKVL